jgi:hypothetical protein
MNDFTKGDAARFIADRVSAPAPDDCGDVVTGPLLLGGSAEMTKPMVDQIRNAAARAVLDQTILPVAPAPASAGVDDAALLKNLRETYWYRRHLDIDEFYIDVAPDHAARRIEFLLAHTAALEQRVRELEEALEDAVAHLAGATSAYETFAGNSKRAGVRDALYTTRLSDFKKATERTRAALAPAPTAQGE